MQKMKAALCTRYGPPEVYVETGKKKDKVIIEPLSLEDIAYKLFRYLLIINIISLLVNVLLYLYNDKAYTYIRLDWRNMVSLVLMLLAIL